MSQESWKYFLNCSYIMAFLLFVPTHYDLEICYFFYFAGAGIFSPLCYTNVNPFIYWIFGVVITRSIPGSGILIEVKYWFYSPYIIIVSLVSSFTIILTAIITNYKARKIKKGKKTKIKILQLLTYIHVFLIFINFSLYPLLPFFGYILWIFALFLFWNGILKFKNANKKKMHNLNVLFSSWLISITLLILMVIIFDILNALYIITQN